MRSTAGPGSCPPFALWRPAPGYASLGFAALGCTALGYAGLAQPTLGRAATLQAAMGAALGRDNKFVATFTPPSTPPASSSPSHAPTSLAESRTSSANGPIAKSGAALRNGWRVLTAPRQWSGRMPPSTSTISTQFWMDAAPWRLTAGWSMLAALLASGALLEWKSVDLRQLVLLWLLGDLFWGALWRLSGGRQTLLPLRAGTESARPRLPYLREQSPAAELLSLDEDNALPYLVRVALPALIVGMIVAAVLGIPALVCTALMALVAVAGWTLRSTMNVPPLFLHAIAIVGLPWTLMILYSGDGGSASQTAVIALGVFWTLHAWGEARSVVWGQDRIGLVLLGVAEAAVAILLIVNKAPIGVPILAALVLPTWLRAARGLPLTGLSVWWTAAMLASALALGWK